MYPLDQAPTDTLLREIQYRIDAMRGCVMPAYDVEEIVRELADRAGRESDSHPAGVSRERVARLYLQALGARHNIRGLADVDRWTPVSLAEVVRSSGGESGDGCEAFASERSRLDDPEAKAQAEEDLRAAVRLIHQTHGLRGARGFVDWFSECGEEAIHVTEHVSFVEIEHHPDNAAPERALVWYRDREGLERSMAVGTIRKWLKAAHDAASLSSDEISHPKRVWDNERIG